MSLLTYLGHFRLPAGPQARDLALPEALWQFARFAYGGRALCLWDGGRALAVSGHNIGDLVATVRIPDVVRTAEVRTPFREFAPRAALNAAHLDEIIGVAEHEGRLVGLYQDYYDVDGVDGRRVSFWDGDRLVQLGAGELKRHAGYLTAHDGSLWCGRSDGAGSADVQHGPALYRVEPGFTLDRYEIPPRPDWTEADRYTALVFLPGHVCWLVSKDVIPRRLVWRDGKNVLVHPWYGGPVSPEGLEDKWNESKGYHTERRQVKLLPYAWPSLEEQAPIVLTEFHESSKCGGAAYDPELRRLYVHETLPVVAGRDPVVQIHVYDVDGEAPATEPVPVPQAAEVWIDVEGVGSFTGSGVWRRA